MTDIIVTMSVRPDSPERNTAEITKQATAEIEKLDGKVGKTETKELAFGLKEIFIHFFWDEKRGSADETETKVAQINGVQSATITNVTRALG